MYTHPRSVCQLLILSHAVSYLLVCSPDFSDLGFLWLFDKKPRRASRSSSHYSLPSFLHPFIFVVAFLGHHKGRSRGTLLLQQFKNPHQFSCCSSTLLGPVFFHSGGYWRSLWYGLLFHSANYPAVYPLHINHWYIFRRGTCSDTTNLIIWIAGPHFYWCISTVARLQTENDGAY